ncbi:DUF2231 domain-containing protein [Cellulomonas marina]|uniref:Uncharacterized membrane protein n=1 Tax=Cellulomonas marina TaxID=988821 RepID=A0A1I1AE52_9CELL|nr:DUF2231 domain-containing protein [Cellulomonas marina]GIG29691.1 membrane protein [Cellulomonas marina]SFB36275.1 Uncharacterized membrane protein [Cellulomonas marina]
MSTTRTALDHAGAGVYSRSTARHLTDALERRSALDPAVAVLEAVARPVVGGERRWRTLRGAALGHPLHPVLTDAPVGLWTSSVVLDLVGGEGAQDAADRLLGLGVLAAVPAVITGLADWSAGDTGVRRVGVVHAALNGVALAGFAGAWLLRRRGHRRAGVAASLASFGIAGGGAYLGGHLAYATGARPQQSR